MALVQSTMRATSSSKTTSNVPGLDFTSNIGPFTGPRHVRRDGQYSQGPEVNAFALPTRRMADSFMRCFWDCTHPIFPILHKPTFVISYDSLWVPQSESFSDNVSGKAEDPIFLSTLNIVFAIGCQFSDLVAPDRRTNLGDQFYQRSRALYDIDALDSASILTVQMLLLTGLYLQSTKYASRCWHMVGLAIRTAQDIGIHIEHTRPSKTQLEREMRRRVWHNCIIMDRLLALTFGRPNMISGDSGVPLPLVIDDEYLKQDGEGIQPSQSECSMRFFVFSIQLFEILDRIMSKIYRYESVNPSNEGGEDFWWSRDRLEDVLKLNNALDDWHDTLPNNLRLQCATEARADLRSDTAILQAKVLYSRFLYIRILLLRPALLSAAQNRHHLPKGDDWRHLRLEEQLALKMRFIEVQVGVQFINLGIHWAASVPAFLSVASVPFPVILYIYGEKILKRCRYAAEAEEFTQGMRQKKLEQTAAKDFHDQNPSECPSRYDIDSRSLPQNSFRRFSTTRSRNSRLSTERVSTVEYEGNPFDVDRVNTLER
ncbi:hypothetical protein Asppvi_005393 [Aspergillus pseudoviridinutans]|uniref:Xylanolytic transcriptional activator regulatory domain-containing protein n=1 Tax=Aspergillus pseudoviridinutans TaxID=1517512 RepID=A0A9P3BEK3_9EURO|nr:uncharacterized protein Asppvi_005393 [Aspergillus pseudoviridinutans]GIJ86504.1 hypothetical protein Asppvi_005393 [Aspergillus pseudoviridinutans]